MSDIENIVYQVKCSSWFFLDLLTYSKNEGTVTISVFPNDDPTLKRSYLFSSVSRFSVELDDCLEDFPMQIIGIDWNNKRQVVINCAEVEYVFYTNKLPVCCELEDRN